MDLLGQKKARPPKDTIISHHKKADTRQNMKKKKKEVVVQDWRMWSELTQDLDMTDCIKSTQIKKKIFFIPDITENSLQFSNGFDKVLGVIYAIMKSKYNLSTADI